MAPHFLNGPTTYTVSVTHLMPFNRNQAGWEQLKWYNTYLPSMYEALGSMPSTTKKNQVIFITTYAKDVL
jgi:hypothetical protein